MTTPAEHDTPTCDLAHVTVPWVGEPRTVTCARTYPSDLDPDGQPLTITVESPDCPYAVEACGGEIAWSAAVRGIRYHALAPDAWAPEHHGITLRDLGGGLWRVDGPYGSVAVTYAPEVVR